MANLTTMVVQAFTANAQTSDALLLQAGQEFTVQVSADALSGVTIELRYQRDGNSPATTFDTFVAADVRNGKLHGAGQVFLTTTAFGSATNLAGRIIPGKVTS